MTTTEISKAIKIYCKEKYPTWKFSVTSECFSGGSSINISVMEAPEQIFDLDACRKAYAKHLENEKMGYYGCRGLGMDIEKMLADDNMHWQLHSIGERDKEYFTEYGFSVLENVYKLMQSYNFDDSDSMIDYSHCNFYGFFNIGKWNKGFKVVPKTARIKNKGAKLSKTKNSSPMKGNAAKTANTALPGEKNRYTFNQFVIDSLNRRFSGDWGDVSVADAADNTDDPLNAMSAYTGPDGMKIWIKQDYNIITVLFPDQY